MDKDFRAKIEQILNDLTKNRTSYFISYYHEIAFYLHMNNPSFDEHLDICRVHMIDKEKASELCDSYRRLFQTIKPTEQYHNLDYIKIEQDIDALYNRLTAAL